MSEDGNRTPVLGLRYSTDEHLNLNWNTLDTTISNAFQPDSPIQFPPTFLLPEQSVVKQSFYPGESIYAATGSAFATEGICLLGDPFRAFEPTPIDSMGGRGGPFFAVGCCALSIQNSTAQIQQADLTVTLYAYGTSIILVNRCPMSLPPSCKLPAFVPLSGYGRVTSPPLMETYEVWVEVMKTSGADASVILRVEGGQFALVEMP